MEIILISANKHLGNIGDVINVKNGYGRYLITQELALRATAENRTVFEERKLELESKNEEARKIAADVAANIDGSSYNIIRQASDDGKLYGSVTTKDIAHAVNIKIEKTHKSFVVPSMVVLKSLIKTIGMYEITLELHHSVAATIKLYVARSESEAVDLASTTRKNTEEEEEEIAL